jgi:hypothetical protein
MDNTKKLQKMVTRKLIDSGWTHETEPIGLEKAPFVVNDAFWDSVFEKGKYSIYPELDPMCLEVHSPRFSTAQEALEDVQSKTTLKEFSLHEWGLNNTWIWTVDIKNYRHLCQLGMLVEKEEGK